MVRPKRKISAEKRTEVDALLSQTKKKFATDLNELEQTKRHFSLAFVEAMDAEFEKLFEKEVLNAKLTDYINGEDQDVPQGDCTWFGHSIAASLRQMPIQTKKLAKIRIQQVVSECILTTDAGGNGNEMAQQNDRIDEEAGKGKETN